MSLQTNIAKALDQLGQSFASDAAAQMATLLVELERWNQNVNLTAIRDLNDMITGHLLDSLIVRPLLEGDRILERLEKIEIKEVQADGGTRGEVDGEAREFRSRHRHQDQIPFNSPVESAKASTPTRSTSMQCSVPRGRSCE